MRTALPSLTRWAMLAVCVLFGLTTSLHLSNHSWVSGDADGDLAEGASKRAGFVSPAVVNGPGGQPVNLPALLPSGFTPQTRLGYTSGDQWEPAIAADRFGHVYLLFPQYNGVPGCPTCDSPTMILQVSADRGASWSAPRLMYPAGASTGQWDAQIVVDPVDGKTVYAAWLQDGKSDTVVARSDDFGANWRVVVANHTNAGTDKPILVVRGQDVYVAYDHAQKSYVASSHDGGATFTDVAIPKGGKLGWALAGGGAITPNGHIYFGWAGYEQNGGAKGPVNLFISKSSDHGQSWSNTTIDISQAPPDCSAYQCGWAYLGAQVTLDADAAGTIYALWNANSIAKGANRIYFAKSVDGIHWSVKQDVSSAPMGSAHAFPAISAGAAGDVRIAWMDARVGARWNTYYRSSRDGGATWSNEVDLSTAVSGLAYIDAHGFAFPFGDYYEMTIDDQGNSHVVWGEGANYRGPGSIWYSKGR